MKMEKLKIVPYSKKDLAGAVAVWNEVVEEGNAFPQETPMTEQEADAFFSKQDFVGVAYDKEQVVGLYILHPNNVGRCGHHANASYAVRSELRGLHIGECLARHSLEQAKRLGYRLLVFNVVVKGNDRAVRLYEKLGFVKVGEIPGGFRRKDGTYADTMIFYHAI